MKKTHLNWE